MEDLLSGVRVHIAELRSVNRGAGTYNLPSETLSAIFEAGLPETPKTRERGRASWFDQSEERTTPFELLVSSVSRRWRNVALQTPRLWTVLVIDALGLTHDLYDLYLHRSKMCPLDITLVGSYKGQSGKSDCDINVSGGIWNGLYPMLVVGGNLLSGTATLDRSFPLSLTCAHPLSRR
jgi:hypothetical protein